VKLKLPLSKLISTLKVIIDVAITFAQQNMRYQLYLSETNSDQPPQCI